MLNSNKSAGPPNVRLGVVGDRSMSDECNML